MNMKEVVVYEPNLGLEGTIPELVDWANKHTSDYSDRALERITELAGEYGLDIKYIEIPLLLRNERLKEGNGTLESAYARLKIDNHLGNKISMSISNYGSEGTELEVWSEDDKVIISLTGSDDEGIWHAAGKYDLETEFMTGACNWLDVEIGKILFYSKEYEEEQ